MDQADGIRIVETAIAALDTVIGTAEDEGIPPDLRSRLIDQRTRSQALRMRLSFATASVLLSQAETDALQAASQELDAGAAEISSIDYATRLVDLASTVGGILDSSLSLYGLLPGNDPTKPKG